MNCFFVSDVHLGASDDPGGARERKFVDFLRSLPDDTDALYLLGDIFDFWVEYDDVVPSGYLRVLGELARLSDRGVKLVYYKGNHDWWMNGYLEREIGMEVVGELYRVEEINGLNICLGHGDGIGKISPGEKFIFRLFRSKLNIRALKMLHPYFVFRFARRWAANSRRHHGQYVFNRETTPLYGFARSLSAVMKIDYFIFGHLHCPVAEQVAGGGVMYVLNDWGAGTNYLNLSGIYISGLGLPKIER